MGVGSNPRLANVILGLKSSFMHLKSQKGLFICPKLMPKAKKFKKQKINSVPLRTTVLGALKTVRSHKKPKRNPKEWTIRKLKEPFGTIKNHKEP